MASELARRVALLGWVWTGVAGASGPHAATNSVIEATCPPSFSDCTDALANALQSCAPEVLIAQRSSGAPWVTDPVKLTCSGQRVSLASGVAIEAKRGSFKGKGDCLITMDDLSNVTLEGPPDGTGVLRMWREDYSNPALYNHSEGRHAVSMHGVNNVRIASLRIELSGGDGIYIANSWSDKGKNSRNVTVSGVISDRNYRQGMSVIGVTGLLVIDTVLSNTNGTPPMAGVDFEPNSALNSLADIHFQNVTASGNSGRGFQMSLMNCDNTTEPISITFTNCTVASSGSYGFSLSGTSHGLPASSNVRVNEMAISNTGGAGILVESKSGAMALTFANVSVREVSPKANAPVWIEGVGTPTAGVTLDVVVADTVERNPVQFMGQVTQVTGSVRVTNPTQCRPESPPPGNTVEISCVGDKV